MCYNKHIKLRKVIKDECGTDGAYIFEEMEYGTGETYRYISTNWLPYDAVYLLTVDKETDEVLVVWKTADDGPHIEAVG